jgi:two-component system, NtrC family, response regulator HydG
MTAPGTPSAASPSPAGRVLFVDDQRNMRVTTAMVLRQAGYEVDEAEGGAAALERVGAEPFDVVLTDLRMGDVDGMAVLRGALELSPSLQVIVMTAFGSIESAVEAVRRGAYDYLTKPFQSEELLVRVQKAVEKRRLLGEMSLLAGDFRRRYGLENVVGRSPALREVLDRAIRVASTDATVLLTGESGTGKELVARAIHAGSRRSGHAFVPVNCAAITETLLESELFGHARGAFTGAIRARVGLFEEASGGTLFIDEIGETTPGFQAKLLRALQEGEIRRVGESSPVKVDVRIIAATNQDLRRAIAEKRFREDLFYRLNVVPLRIPPLRERREDIPLLARHFLERCNRRGGGQKRWTVDALSRMLEHDWPGNVRELENVVEQAAALSDGPEIRASEVAFGQEGLPAAGSASLADVVEGAERRAIEAALVRCGGDQGRVARELQISATTLWRKMKRLRIG